MDTDRTLTPNSENGAGPSAPETRVLITGAAGFIGSHLCDRLLDAGCSVWGLDNFDRSYDPGRKRRNLAGALTRDDMHLVEGDVRDAVLLDGLLGTYPFDAVVHLAAMPGDQASTEAPSRSMSVNVRGTLSLLEALARHDVRRLVFGSTSTVYGPDAPTPFEESDAADRPASPNAASKRAGELYCHSFHVTEDLSVHCLRAFSAYGPRQRPDTVVHRFAELLVEDRPLTLFGDGSTERDFTYVGDVVDGIVRSLGRLLERGRAEPDYRVVNLGAGRPVRLDRMAEALARALGTAEPRFEQMPRQAWDLPRTHASVERARDLLGWSAETGLEEGLEAFAAWFLRERRREDEADGSAAAVKSPESSPSRPPTAG